MDAPVRWPAEALWEAVAPQWPGFTVEVLPEIDSSNSELMRRARAGRIEPVLLVAERQSAGRGRLGRSWSSAPGESLTFSIGVPLAPANWSGLSLAVGVAIARALHPAVGLKWPNDLWVEDRKLGGILIETASLPDVGTRRHAVVGVGLNVRAPAAGGLSTPPASLRELDPGLRAELALARIVPPLMQALRLFEAEGFAPFQHAFAERDVLAGRPVVLSDGRDGMAQGVAADGALRVQTAAGLQSVNSAEVSVRPRTGPL